LEAQNAGLGQRVLMYLIGRFGKLEASNLWLMLMHNFRLMRGFLLFAPKLMPYGELDRRDTELVILRVAWNCRARYEWGQHVDIGIRAGLSVEEVVRVSLGSDVPGWERGQIALLRAVDEFHHERMVADTTWAMLREFYDQRLLLELLFLIGFYEGLAGVLNSTGLALNAAPEQRLAETFAKAVN
jgi:alkylhydroperoxidase family enzyme